MTKRLAGPRQSSALTRPRVAKEARAVYAAPLVVRAVYRRGRFEPQEPVAALDENQIVDLVIQVDGVEARTRAAQLVQRAKQRAAQLAATLTPDKAWAEYDRAAAALRRELRRS